MTDRPAKVTDRFGYVEPELLDAYIASWIKDNLEEAVKIIMMRRGGEDFWSEIQEELSNQWVSEHKDEVPGQWDLVEYKDSGINFVRRQGGYTKGLIWYKCDDSQEEVDARRMARKAIDERWGRQ